MINPRKIATLGIGFGFVAIAAIGFVSDIPTQPEQVVSSSGGHKRKSYTFKKIDDKTTVINLNTQEDDDEEAIILLLLSELTQLGYFNG